MEVPPGFESNEGLVCKLKKALYGLKQSPRAWFAKVMTTLGQKESQGDHTLFVKHSKSGAVTALLVYVDDIIVTCNDVEGMQSLKYCLVKQFDIKELGKLKYFMGIEVAHLKQGILISQQKYVLDLLKKIVSRLIRQLSSIMGCVRLQNTQLWIKIPIKGQSGG